MMPPELASPFFADKPQGLPSLHAKRSMLVAVGFLLLLAWSQADTSLSLLSFLAEEGTPVALLGLAALGAGITLAIHRTRRRDPDEEQEQSPALASDFSLAALSDLALLSPDLIAISDARGCLRYLNPEGRRLLALPADAELSRLSLQQMFPQSARNLVRLEPPPQAAWRGETVLQTHCGDHLPVQQTLMRQDGAEGTHWVVVARDLSERDKAKQDLWRQTHLDLLTGLANRYLLDERLGTLGAALLPDESLALLCFSIGRFRDVNDVFGQQAGDGVLREMAKRFNAVAPDSMLLARIGGTEFAVVVRNIRDRGDLAPLIERVRGQVTRPIQLGDSELRFSCHMGVALCPQDARTPEQLMSAAEIALRQAKRAGGGRCEFYSQQLDRDTREQLFLESHLRQALANDELRLEFQPQIRVADGQMCGVEALLRWHHPNLGLIGPTRFIPVAEASGLIVPIGEWVLRAACFQQVAWQRSGQRPLRVAVNLSAQQFLHADVLDQVENAIAYSGIDPRYVELEITESSLMEDAASAKKLMRSLSALGVKIAIDDFGTGYSSLAYLKEFPLDRIKIDRCFVSDVPHDENVSIITRTILTLAQSLGMGTIAEGVENAEQIDFLQRHGCEELQGYIFSRPLPPTRVEEFLEHSEACCVGKSAWPKLSDVPVQATTTAPLSVACSK